MARAGSASLFRRHSPCSAPPSPTHLGAPALARGGQPLATLDMRGQPPVAAHQLPEELRSLHAVLVVDAGGLRGRRGDGHGAVRG